MALQARARLGPYEIQAPLGAGGMGEVYKATDTRLDRTVAIKVLPAELATDPARRERFEREAKTISSLNHPHICTLHDVGHQDGVDFLVMEHLEGETLQDRLTKGALPLDLALRYAIEVADALDKAHRQGIVHRDLKPGNIMLTKAGAKLLDFGLAKLRKSDLKADLTALASMPTQAQPITEKGTVLGTVQYMAPEQLEGRDADVRTDVFAFGAIAYEMVTGRLAFEAKSQLSLITAILEHDPPPISKQQMTSPGLDRVVRTCLAKDPDHRWQSVADVGRQLTWIRNEESGAVVGGPQLRIWQRPQPALLAVLLLTTLVALGALVTGPLMIRSSPTPGSGPGDAFSVSPPAGANLSGEMWTVAAISPDGGDLVVVAEADGTRQLFHRPLHEVEAAPIPGTAGAENPFFSPDGEWVGFKTGAFLWRTRLDGGQAQMICQLPDDGVFTMGASWATDDTVWIGSFNSGLHRVVATGGTPQEVTVPEADHGVIGHHTPQPLPNGRGVIYTMHRGTLPAHWLGIYQSATGEQRSLGRGGYAWFARTGHIVFAIGSRLWALAFDVEAFEAVGEPSPVLEDVRITHITDGRSQAYLGRDGTLVYVPAHAAIDERAIVWVDRQGNEEPLVEATGAYFTPELSPDGTQLAFRRAGDIFVRDLARGTNRRLTFHPSMDISPQWTHDGGRIVFASNRESPSGPGFKVFAKAADGTGQSQLLYGDPAYAAIPWDWSGDGQTLIMMDLETAGPSQANVSRLSFDADPERQPIFAGNRYEGLPAMSPNGRWIAYVSNESGQFEVYVAAYPDPEGGRWQISTDGGVQPLWSRDGRELFYRHGLGCTGRALVGCRKVLMSVPVDTGGQAFDHGTAAVVFGDPYYTSEARDYDVSLDGERFVMIRGAETPPTGVRIMRRWTDQLGGLQMPAP